MQKYKTGEILPVYAGNALITIGGYFTAGG
jgi:hypothetical protein